MKIASLVVRAAPDFLDDLIATLPQIPGVEVHGASHETGRLVVSVEDGDGYSMADSIIAVNISPHVQGVTMAYEYTDEGLELSAQEDCMAPTLASLVAPAGGAASFGTAHQED